MSVRVSRFHCRCSAAHRRRSTVTGIRSLLLLLLLMTAAVAIQYAWSIAVQSHCIQFLWVVISFGHRSLHFCVWVSFLSFLSFRSRSSIRPSVSFYNLSLSSLNFWTMLHTNFIRFASTLLRSSSPSSRNFSTTTTTPSSSSSQSPSLQLIGMCWKLDFEHHKISCYWLWTYGSRNRLIICARARAHHRGTLNRTEYVCILFLFYT